MRAERNTVYCWRDAFFLLVPLIGFISCPVVVAEVVSQDFNIRRQSLSAALLDFSYQADIQIVMPGYLAEGMVSRKVRGALSPAQALDILLKDTGLEYEFISPGTVAIRRQPAQPQPGRRRRHEDREMEQLFVTAEERREALRDISISMATLNGEDLESRGITKADQLQEFIPGLTVGGAQIGNTEFSIRGIGIGGDNLVTQPGVGVFIDDIYIPRQGPANMVLYELERVEVLRGPQATLYSHNAIGGALSYITRQPPESFEGRYLVDFGNKGRLNNIVTVGGDLASGVAAQLAAASFKRDPVTENRNPGHPDGNEVDSSAARMALRLTVSDRLEWLMSADTEKTDQDSVLYSLGPEESFQFAPGLPLLPASTPVHSADVNASGEFLDIRGLMARANLTTDAYRASFIFGRREHELGGLYDLDQSRQELVAEQIFERSRLASFEARFLSLPREGKADTGDIDWLAGLYFLRETGDAEKVYFAPGLDAGTNRWRQDMQSRSYALFGQTTYWLTDQLRLVSGLRYVADFDVWDLEARTTMPGGNNPYLQEDFVISRRQDWRRLTPKLAINFDYSPDTSVYVSVTSGFKAGGFVGTPGNRLAAERQFDPVQVDNLEFGVHSRLFANRMKVNFAVFSAEYRDLQVTGDDTYGKSFVANAEETHINGMELEVQARPSPSLKLSMGLSVLDARFNDFELALDDGRLDKTGERVPRIPDATFNLSGVYYFPETNHGFYSFRADVHYSEEAAGLQAEEAWPSYRSYNLWFDFLPNHGNWEVSAWVRNAADNDYFQASSPGVSSSHGAYARKLAPPRMYGLSFKQYW